MSHAPGGVMKGGDLPHAIEYPVRDDEPMGETDRHRDALKDYAVNVLLDHFAGQRVYVSGNNFLYYVEGDPKAVVSPDTYVVRGVEQRLRDTYKVWEEGGRRPCFVLEITSKSSRKRDLGKKQAIYRDDLEVPEYFLYDPFGEWIPEQLRGFRLEQPGCYVPVEPDARGRLLSQQLGLELGLDADGWLRFHTPGAESPLPTRAERAEQERERAEQERERADAAVAELQQLRAELERLRQRDD